VVRRSQPSTGGESRYLGTEKLFKLLQQWKKPQRMGESLRVWCRRAKMEKLGIGREINDRGASWALMEGTLTGNVRV